jgi:PadR family transcriptional regulator PadR
MSRLQKEGLVIPSLEASPEGPARKYYRLSADGEAVLDRINMVWDEITAGVNALRKREE